MCFFDFELGAAELGADGSTELWRPSKAFLIFKSQFLNEQTDKKFTCRERKKYQTKFCQKIAHTWRRRRLTSW